MDRITVYAAINVVYDHYRFEEFRGVAASIEEARDKYWDGSVPLMQYPAGEIGPGGTNEQPHVWLCPIEVVAERAEQPEGARNWVTRGQFDKLKPSDPDKANALAAFLFNPDQPSGYDLDREFGLVSEAGRGQYTVRAAKALRAKVVQAMELAAL